LLHIWGRRRPRKPAVCRSWAELGPILGRHGRRHRRMARTNGGKPGEVGVIVDGKEYRE